MKTQTHFLRGCKMFGLAASAVFYIAGYGASAVAQQIGEIAFSIGAPSGLSKGQAISVGDTISTAEGRVQIRLDNRSFMSLQPNTVLSVNEFNTGTGSFELTLQNGGVRAVGGAFETSGTVSYQLNTPFGEIKVESLEFLVNVDQDMTVSVGMGNVTITNDAGTFKLNSGQSAQVYGMNSLPSLIRDRVQLLAAQPGDYAYLTDMLEALFVAADQRGEGGLQQVMINILANAGELPETPTTPTDPETPTTPTEPETPSTPTTPTTGVTAPLGEGPYFIAYAGSEVGVDEREEVTATFGSAGEMESYSTTSGIEAPEIGTNTASGVAGNAYVAIGQWTNGDTGGSFYGHTYSFNENEGFHYAIGLPSENLPASGTATYNLMSATAPTWGDGSKAPGTFTGDIAIAFGSTPKVGVDLSVDMPGDAVYSIVSTGGTADPSQSQVSFSAGASNFYGNVPITGAGGAACSTGGTCEAILKGFVGGPDADFAGLVYMIWSGGSGGAPNTIEGAALFGK